MDPNYESPSVATESTTLNMTAASLQRLDDKLATGMSIADVARVRWLTDVEVLQYLDQAFDDDGGDGLFGGLPKLSICTSPPSTPPITGTLLLYKASETPNYAEDGIEWIQEKGAASWVNIAGVLAGENVVYASSESSKLSSTPKKDEHAFGSFPNGAEESNEGSSSKCSTAMGSGATVQYLTSVKTPTFHRREYRGPNDIILLQYLDSVRALRMTAELVDRIVELSTFSRTSKRHIKDKMETDRSMSSTEHRGKKLDDTMNILYGMVNEHDAMGTSTNEASEEGVLNSTTNAALTSLVKHCSPDEAASIVDAMDFALDDDMLDSDGGFGDVNNVTEFDISEAIDQVLSGKEAGNETEAELEEILGEVKVEKKGAAAIIEDRILASFEGAIPEELKLKLIKTTETLLNVAGVHLSSGKGEKGGGDQDSASVGSGTASTRSTSYEAGSPLTEIVDITPDFHMAGHYPPKSKKNDSKVHVPSMVISTESAIPDLPPFVDHHSTWVTFACFVDFLEMSRDPTVRNISFERLTPITPYSYKCPIPAGIRDSSTRHVIIVGVLLPKDHRQKVSMVGVELALKLSIQAEWMAAADIVLALKRGQVIENAKPLVSGLRRPLLVVPCGGTRMQLLSQISEMKFTFYPHYRESKSISGTSVGPEVRRSSVARSDNSEDAKKSELDRSNDEKRKRDEYIEELGKIEGIVPTMTSHEVDRHRKIRFVERMTNAISNANELSHGMTHDGNLDGTAVDNMNDEEIDALLGQVLMRFVEISIESSTDESKLRDEINFCGYSGLALLHHAAFYNYAGLATNLLNHGANPDVLSSAGKLTPLHFAASAGHKDMVNLLIQSGCNPVPIDADNLTPADHAMRAGNADIARDLDSHIQQSGIMKPNSNSTPPHAISASTVDVLLQSAFKELSLKDKLGLNLFATRTTSTGDDSSNMPMESFNHVTNTAPPETEMMTDLDDGLENFAFISEDDRIKLRAAMSLANGVDLDEMNRRAANQDVSRFLRQSNYEAIKAASKALDKANKKESDFLKSVSRPEDPSKMQLSRALAMLVLRKNMRGSS